MSPPRSAMPLASRLRGLCCLLPVCAAFLGGCATDDSDGKNLAALRRIYGPEAPSDIQDSVATPPHSMSRADYPFDSRGNYREEWVTSSSSASPRSSGSGSGRASAPSRTTIHVVKKGDTLYGISRRYGVTLYSLRKINKLTSYTIRPGQRLRIPPQ